MNSIRSLPGRFKNADRLIIDMRGNPGGGIGGLTLMSYLTPGRHPIGYSKSREMARNNISPDALPVFDKVPRSKLALPTLAIKFLGKTSIFLYTEALGSRDWHGRTAILVDEHTAGAAEWLPSLPGKQFGNNCWNEDTWPSRDTPSE